MTGFGPLFQLQVAGALCPCLERSENRNARLAVAEINQKCRQVDWQMPNNSNGSAGSFLGGLFQRNNAGKSTGGSCRARLTLRDSGGDGKPEIFVDPLNVRSTPVTDDDNDDGDPAPSPGYKLNVKLRRVDKVILEEDQIVLYARKAQSSQPAKELLRFAPLQCGGNGADDGSTTADTALPMVSDARNMLVHHFMVIVEWERQRTKDDYDDDDDDDENQPNFLQARAQKAAHFAKREIEMQKTRKEREKRKAKLMAETGGLKYTAMVMANNSSIT